MSETSENGGYKFIRARNNGEKNRSIENRISNLANLVEKNGFAKEKMFSKRVFGTFRLSTLLVQLKNNFQRHKPTFTTSIFFSKIVFFNQIG